MKRIIHIILILGISALGLNAQDTLIREVIVEKQYTPTMDIKNKINDLPFLNDTAIIKPLVQYYVIPHELESGFELTPLKPARLLGVPISKLYNSYVRVGFGNYITPMAEFYTQSSRNRGLLWGAYAKHNGHYGKIHLDNDKKVSIDQGTTEVSGFAKKMFEKSVLSANLDVTHRTNLFYGLNPAIDTVINNKNLKQKYTGGQFSAIYKSLNSDSNSWNYEVIAKSGIFNDNFKNKQTNLGVTTFIDKYLKQNKLGIHASYNGNMYTKDTFNVSILNVRPYLNRRTEHFNIYVGLNAFVLNDIRQSKTFINPVGLIEYNVFNYYVIPYVGVGGEPTINDWQSISYENPYIAPSLHVKPSNTEIRFYGGVKGNYSPKLSYNIGYLYQVIDNQYFFVNDTSSNLMNHFVVLYDDIEHSQYMVELQFNYSKRLRFLAKAERNKYLMQKLAQPFHKSLLSGSFAILYSIADKIQCFTEIIYQDKRYVQQLSTFNKPEYTKIPLDLNPYLNANLRIEYRYSSVLSGFISLNNIASQKYQEWNFYPTLRFHGLIGITYAF